MPDSFLWPVVTDRVTAYATKVLARIGKRGEELDALVADSLVHAYAIIRQRSAAGPCPIGETVQSAAKYGVGKALRGSAALGEDWSPQIVRGKIRQQELPATIAAATARPDKIDAGRLTPQSAIVWTLLARGDTPAEIREQLGVSGPTLSRRLEALRDELLYQL